MALTVEQEKLDRIRKGRANTCWHDLKSNGIAELRRRACAQTL
ncbi:hypothetical protein BH10CYA1_BH10CYA1_20400 [soil metagenome]